MQKVLLATSLLASANVQAYNNIEIKFINDWEVQRMSAFSTFQKASPAEKKGHSLSARKVLEEEVSVSGKKKSHSGKFFEIHAGRNDDCSGTLNVFGLETGYCVDGFENYNPDIGNAEAYSEVMYHPNNEGFPIAAYFRGHGCNWDSILYTERLAKTVFGFSRKYKPDGTCEETSESYIHANWSDTRHQPAYPAIMEGYDSKFSRCEENNFAIYSFLNADTCYSKSGEAYGILFYKYSFDDKCNFNPDGRKYISYRDYANSDCTEVDGPLENKFKSEDGCTMSIDYFQETLINREHRGVLRMGNRICLGSTLAPGSATP
jgi:hypothetical protein